MTMGEFANYLFGAGDPAKALGVLTQLFTQQRNRLSYQFTDVVEADDKVIGVLLSYPGRMMNHLGISTGKQLWEIYGAIKFIRFVRRALPLAFAREAGADEYFINTLAVLPDFQGQGIGTYLMSYAEHKARNMNCNKCALNVEVSNLRACHLYERLGYRMVETVKFDWGSRGRCYGSYGFPFAWESLYYCTIPLARHRNNVPLAPCLRKFAYEQIIARDKTSLDIFWLKDKSLADLDNLPEPDELALEIIENLEAC